MWPKSGKSEHYVPGRSVMRHGERLDRSCWVFPEADPESRLLLG